MCQRYHGKENAITIPFEEDYLPLLQRCTSSEDSKSANNDWETGFANIFITALDATIRKYMSQNSVGKASVAGSLLILDHITSNTAIHLPIASIAKYAKEEYGMIVGVDGAHALLGLPLDVASILTTGDEERGHNNGNGNVDMYLTNAHKWLSSPRGAAVLFCANPEIRDTILAQPAVISHGVDDGFLSRFLWDGCRDYTAQLSLPAIFDYWTAANADTVRGDMSRNLKEGIRILISHWHPGVLSDNGDDANASCIEKYSGEAGLTLIAIDKHAPMMALVRLPDHNISGRLTAAAGSERKTSTDAKMVQDYLYAEHSIEVPIKCVRGKLYARVSCHTYNTADEFERLAQALLSTI